MGVAQLVEAFNSVAAPTATAERATLSYQRAHDTEWQVLGFSGIRADGTAFVISSEKLRPNSDVLEASRQTALTLLNRGSNP